MTYSNILGEVRKMDQWFKPLPTLTEDLGLIPSTHTAAHIQFLRTRYSRLVSQGNRHACLRYIYIQAKYSTPKIINAKNL